MDPTGIEVQQKIARTWMRNSWSTSTLRSLPWHWCTVFFKSHHHDLSTCKETGWISVFIFVVSVSKLFFDVFCFYLIEFTSGTSNDPSLCFMFPQGRGRFPGGTGECGTGSTAGDEMWRDVMSLMVENLELEAWNLKHPCKKWLFPVDDDSKSLHGWKSPNFHPSIGGLWSSFWCLQSSATRIIKLFSCLPGNLWQGVPLRGKYSHKNDQPDTITSHDGLGFLNFWWIVKSPKVRLL